MIVLSQTRATRKGARNMSSVWKSRQPNRNRNWILAAGATTFVIGASAAGRQGPPPPGLGGPLANLGGVDRTAFDAGRREFGKAQHPEDGLGPVFNGVSCLECHRAGAGGGASADLRVSRVTRIGAIVKGAYSDLAEVGGPLLQARSLREFIPRYPVPGEVVPREAQFVSHRITTPLFGAGLIEAIPDRTILALAQAPQPDGVKGVANMVTNPETGTVMVGKFGWKAQVATLHWFAGDAYLNEMGITNPFFPHENLPQGKPIPLGADIVPDPEDQGSDVAALTAFMRFLAPPTVRGANSRGAQVFESIKCTACHTPTLKTGTSATAALSNQTVNLYSDLLLHRMGTGLADGIQQGRAQGDQFRTAPLWGLGARPFWMHDGRALTIDQAIRAHGGEALAAARRFGTITNQDRVALLQFLNGL